jgi:hypothetical protein
VSGELLLIKFDGVPGVVRSGFEPASAAIPRERLRDLTFGPQGRFLRIQRSHFR